MTMKIKDTRYVLTLAAMAVLLAAGSVVAADGIVENIPVTSGQKVEIDLSDGGCVTIKGWDEEEVEVTCSDKHRDIEDYEIEIKKTRYGVKVTAELKYGLKRSTNLWVNVKVPRKFDVDLFTAGGALEFRDFEGEIEGKTNGGGIELEDMKGEVQLKTNGGAIEVTDCDLDGKIHTNGGAVALENVVGDLRVKTNGGAISYENVRYRSNDDEDFGDVVQASTGGGSVDVDGAPGGVSVRTGGGAIDVSNAARIVEATTGGGDIDIHIINGRIEASTGAGDIDVMVDESPGKSGGSVELLTGAGDVTLRLPADFSADFDIDLGYTRNSRRDFEIECDFKITLEHTDEWDYGNGSPRKHIYGTGTVKGGKHKIRIKTTNGDVRIIKK
jgi:DUF4097 and DUF4098 domain-containing protein YvlB